MRLRFSHLLSAALAAAAVISAPGDLGCTRTEVLLTSRDAAGGCADGGCGCPAGWLDCGGCVDPSTDADHCGVCGHACAPTEQCVAGVCTCAGGSLRCGDGCRDVTRDPDACGDCGTSCSAGERCVSGVCTCLPGLTRCGEECVDTRYDADHCGACEHRCSDDSAGPFCGDGHCSDVPCDTRSPAAEACSPGDSSCVPSATLASHPLHCGDCGETCDADQVCVQGICQSWYLPSGCAACPCSVCGVNLCCSIPGTSDPICVVGVSSCPVQP